MADTPASTTGTSHDFDLSSDEEDDILQNLKQQAQRGTRSSASYDPDASSNFGKTTASSEGTPNFESMRDALEGGGNGGPGDEVARRRASRPSPRPTNP